ncbi:restriction endonuclease subunit S [Lutibacter sp. A64]|uniref:restriction endonuclease subunit S n=1 Tax=Lutibacter sp. A64 TaxID=2918526 RepID=UPI001F05963B|nr:restriction endonuclease subunit S [Lutibacter sp. A64]UMB52957.1 restriction endonuclease subunit S [Lutibacter sp. A64]
MREDWIECNTEDIGQVITGGTPSKKKPEFYSQDDYPFYKPTDLNAGINVKKSKDYLSTLGYANSRKADKNSILVTCIGATIGKTGLIKNDGAFNQQINALIPFEGLSNVFLYYQIIGTVFQQQIKRNAHSTTLPILNKSKFLKLKLNIPPQTIQKAIVKKIEALFSSLDSGIADLKKAQDQLVIYRQAVLKKAFEGGYTQPNAKKGELVINGLQSVIPQNWKVCKIGEIAKLQGGFAFKSAEFTDSGIPIVKIKNVHYQDIDWSDKTFVASSRMKEFNSYSLNKGDVLIAMTRPVIKSLNNIKTVVVKESDLPALLNQRVGRFVINGEVDKNFLKYYIFTDFFKRRVLKESSSSQQPNISSTKIERFDFIVPETIQEQHQIVNEIESRLSVCDKVEKDIADSLEKAQALRQSILKKAFEGTLLSEAEIAKCKADKNYEPASVLLEKIKAEKKQK